MCEDRTKQDRNARDARLQDAEDAFEEWARHLAEDAFAEPIAPERGGSQSLAKWWYSTRDRLDRCTIAPVREPRRRRRNEASASAFLVDARELSVAAQGVGSFWLGDPVVLDVWVRPTGAEFSYSHPSGALVLTGPDHPRARRAWDRGAIAGSRVVWHNYLVPAADWTPWLAAEAMRRWARRQAGRPDVEVSTSVFDPLWRADWPGSRPRIEELAERATMTVTLSTAQLAGCWDVAPLDEGRLLLSPHLEPTIEEIEAEQGGRIDREEFELRWGHLPREEG